MGHGFIILLAGISPCLTRRIFFGVPKNIESLFAVSADFLKAGLIKHIYNVSIGLFQTVQYGLLCVILKQMLMEN